MTLREAAQRLGIGASTVRRRILTGRLHAERDGRRVVITERDLKSYERRERQPACRVGMGHVSEEARKMFPGLYRETR